jgi:hypothetical protein
VAQACKIGSVYRWDTRRWDTQAVYPLLVDQGVVARFEAKVDRSGEHDVWRGAHKADGSGTFKSSGTSPVLARRVAWELANGPLPPAPGC